MKVVHCKKEKYDVYIGRPSKWGNPFTHKQGTLAEFIYPTREEAVAAYRKWITEGDGRYLLKDLHELKGRVLGCWCVPNLCHGHVLVELANKEIMLTYKGFITEELMGEDGIFVFGSNPEGRHRLGTALIAINKYGAIYGKGYGLQGSSYAIATKDLRKSIHPSISQEEIERQIKIMYDLATTSMKNKKFYVAYTGDGKNLNGYSANQMAQMFACAEIPDNIIFEEKFSDMVLGHRHFLKCLKDGEDVERQVVNLLEKEGWMAVSANGSNPHYDILAKPSAQEDYVKIEVKTDLKALETGNVAVELSKNIGGVVKESGLSITHAHYYVYKLKGDNAFYFISTDELKELCNSDKVKRKTIGGDRDSVNLVLIDKNIFCNHCRKIV